MKKITRNSIVVLAIFCILIVPGLITAQPNPPRVVRLESQQSTGPFANAGGTLVLATAAGTLFGELNVRHLPCLTGDPTREGGFFSVYMQTPTNGITPIYTFNTACTLGNMHADFFMPAGTWLTESLTIEVFLEGDDGLDAITAGNTLLLLGSD